MPQKRSSRKAKMDRVMLSIPSSLLEEVDKAAREGYASRSSVIRAAILWYLRPQGGEIDTDVILKTLQHRKARAGMRKIIKDVEKR